MANSNASKYPAALLEVVGGTAREQLTRFGYGEHFSSEMGRQSVELKGFVDTFNEESLKKAQYNAVESDEVTSIFINYPALLLRKKSERYPEGRTSYRFKRFLRKKVTIIDKAAPS